VTTETRSAITVAKVGIGIIGTGTIAQSHLNSLKTSENGQAVAVFDVLGDRAEATAKQFGIPYVAASLADLLARPEVDGVIVCTPPFAHAEPTTAALEAGKHVLCEKPFALDPSEAARMVATADRVGKFLACASARNRYSASQTKARQMLDAGELGDVYYVRSSQIRFRGRPGHHIFPQSKWFLDKQRAGGGAMMDIAVYQIDSVLWLLGNPKVVSVSAQLRQITEEAPPADAPQDVEDHVIILINCESGKSGLVEATWVSNMRGAEGTFIFGTKAGLRLDPLTKIVAERVPAGETIKTPWMGDEVYRTVEEQIFPNPDWARFQSGDVTRGFADALSEGRQPWTSGADALEVTRVIDAAYRSHAEQRTVVLA
jgi:predicted dehydrogenase